MNPKACSVIELYGTLDPVTRDWTDGLLSNIFRDINKPTEKKERKYILFDGDVDALWVENMNSVMDDNRLLTLANGERIRLQAHCALLFEVGVNSDSVIRCIKVTEYFEFREKKFKEKNSSVLAISTSSHRRFSMKKVF